MVAIGDYVVIRKWRTLFSLVSNVRYREALASKLSRLVDDDELICMEIERVSKQKWQLTYIATEDNSYPLDEYEIYFKADCFDTKALLDAKKVMYWNDLLGAQEEYRVKAEQKLNVIKLGLDGKYEFVK